MNKSQRHRGPDESGIWVSDDQSIGLAHTRLSIVDLSSNANQPMSNKNDSIFIVYNGEIYNHALIKKELIKLGVRDWKTDHSDTEVVIKSFEYWGIESIEKFRGMFSIAIWDDKKKELWVIRDRIGIKPLYYTFQNNAFICASEIKAILSDLSIQRNIDEKSFFDFLSFSVVPPPNTLFKGINKLPPGTWLRISADGSTKFYKYWDIKDKSKQFHNMSDNDITDNLIEELQTSIRLRKMSDVPVGVFLSGGLDSSLNARLFSSNSAVKTFSVAYKDDFSGAPSELPYAREMARFINSDHYEHRISINEVLDFVKKMAYHQDEPIADAVCIPLYYVAKLAKENGVKVCQVGEGADELFFGYRGFRRLLSLENFYKSPIPFALNDLSLRMLSIFGKLNRLDYWLEKTARIKKNIPMFWTGTEPYVGSSKTNILSDRMKNKFMDYSSYEIIDPIWKNFNDSTLNNSPLAWYAYADLNIRLPELLLMRVDKMSMANSIECRVPFLDHKFVELAMGVPDRLKVQNGVQKLLLKNAALERNLMPKALINRKKQGFTLPIGEMFSKTELGIDMREELNTFCRSSDLLNNHRINELLNKNGASSLWSLFNVALWHKEYFR